MKLSAFVLEVRLIFSLLPWSNSTATLSLLSTMGVFPSLPFASHGLHLVCSVHDYSFHSNCHGQSPSINHKGLTLDKVMIDVGKREFSSGLTFVACSQVQTTRSSISPPFGFQRLSNLAKAKGCRKDCWKTNDCCLCKYIIQLLPLHIFGAHYNLSVSPIVQCKFPSIHYHFVTTITPQPLL